MKNVGEIFIQIHVVILWENYNFQLDTCFWNTDVPAATILKYGKIL